MKYEYKRLENPTESELNHYGAEGWRVAATTFEQSENGFGPLYSTPIFIMERQALGEVNIEKAIRDGIYDAFSTWVDEMSVATKRKIFSANQD